ncbi:MAG: D-tyrosyl-tRNA(Tyr) deacylase [Clostridiales bacterium 38_11]|nr:MAG: D-tyrosyl-tRNA(Tyr) deacylase [Clostridiales bacterium 38_11]HBH12672.1 D-tyrosyl-tRNA(Tyr) deacylase [Clostridiales bacterium]
MRAVVQRVSKADVLVDNITIGKINKGLLIFLGIAEEDIDSDINYMVDKTLHLRIFEDENDKMNLSVLDVKGEILVISQFTLLGDARKGRRPSFSKAGNPQKAEALYNQYIHLLRNSGITVESGQFAACMAVSLVNDGPVTILLDSTKLF